MNPEKKNFKARIISLDEAYRGCVKLSEKVSASDYSPEAIVAIARGGFPPARFLCDFLNVKTLYSVQIKHYGGGAKGKEKVDVISKNLGDIREKRILLVDDVNDSGKTLSAAYDLLEEASEVRTAVIHQKENTGFRADYAGESVHEWKWLIYQWAAAEDVLDFLKEGDMLNADPVSAKQFLAENYELEVEKSLLEKIFSAKSAYV